MELSKMIQPKEIIVVGVGEAGIKLSGKCWELLMKDYGVAPDGTKLSTELFEQAIGGRCYRPPFDTPNFFDSSIEGKLTPRSLLVDLQPTAIEKLANQRYTDILSMNSVVGGKEDSSGNFARAKYTLGHKATTTTMNKLNQMLEKCESPQGFIILHSVGGGTGSGVTSALIEEIARAYPKLVRWNSPIYPTAVTSFGMLEAYNTVLSMPSMLNFSDLTTPLDCEALHDINRRELDLPISPNLQQMNQIAAQALTLAAQRIRFQATSLEQFIASVTPFPKFHFPILSLSPLASATSEKPTSEKLLLKSVIQSTVFSANSLVKCSLRYSKIFATAVSLRGDYSPQYTMSYLADIRNSKSLKKSFVSGWNGFNIDGERQVLPMFDNSALAKPTVSACCLTNCTAVSELLSRFNYKVSMLYRSRAYLHWYFAQGMDELEMVEAMDQQAELTKGLEQFTEKEVQEEAEEG